MENHVASSTEELLLIARSGFKEIGYQEELLRSEYQFADFLSGVALSQRHRVK